MQNDELRLVVGLSISFAVFSLSALSQFLIYLIAEYLV